MGNYLVLMVSLIYTLCSIWCSATKQNLSSLVDFTLLNHEQLSEADTTHPLKTCDEKLFSGNFSSGPEIAKIN